MQCINNNNNNNDDNDNNNMRMTELQKAILLGTAHILRRIISIKQSSRLDCLRIKDWTRHHKLKAEKLQGLTIINNCL